MGWKIMKWQLFDTRAVTVQSRSIQAERVLQRRIHSLHVRQASKKEIHLIIQNGGEVVGHDDGVEPQSGGAAGG